MLSSRNDSSLRVLLQDKDQTSKTGPRPKGKNSENHIANSRSSSKSLKLSSSNSPTTKQASSPNLSKRANKL